MWFTFVTARLFHSLSIQPRLAATLLSSCSVANSPTRRVGLAPTLRPASLAQALFPPVPLTTVSGSVVAPIQARGGSFFSTRTLSSVTYLGRPPSVGNFS